MMLVLWTQKENGSRLESSHLSKVPVSRRSPGVGSGLKTDLLVIDTGRLVFQDPCFTFPLKTRYTFDSLFLDTSVLANIIDSSNPKLNNLNKYIVKNPSLGFVSYV